MSSAKPGHGDHWLAALDPGDPRLASALSAPLDAPERPILHRRPLSGALDMVQVTAKRRLISAYPEPRATTLVLVKPRELLLWDTGVEGWLVGEHDGAGALTIFLADLVARAADYQAAKAQLAIELAGLAYTLRPALSRGGPSRLRPAAAMDARFLPDDYWFEAEVREVHPADEGVVLELGFHGGLSFPVVSRTDARLSPGDWAEGFLWLSGRLPEDH